MVVTGNRALVVQPLAVFLVHLDGDFHFVPVGRRVLAVTLDNVAPALPFQGRSMLRKVHLIELVVVLTGQQDSCSRVGLELQLVDVVEPVPEAVHHILYGDRETCVAVHVVFGDRSARAEPEYLAHAASVDHFAVQVMRHQHALLVTLFQVAEVQAPRQAI